MPLLSRAAGAVLALTSSAALAADMLPLKQGIYVPVGRPCKGASSAEMVNYWGGRSSIGAAQAGCTIARLAKRGNVYRIADRCQDMQSGQSIGGNTTVLTITAPTAFAMGSIRYRYCGERPVF